MTHNFSLAKKELINMPNLNKAGKLSLNSSNNLQSVPRTGQLLTEKSENMFYFNLIFCVHTLTVSLRSLPVRNNPIQVSTRSIRKCLST